MIQNSFKPRRAFRAIATLALMMPFAAGSGPVLTPTALAQAMNPDDASAEWVFHRHPRGCMIVARYDGLPSTTLAVARLSAQPDHLYLLIYNSGRRVVAGRGQPLQLTVDATAPLTLMAQPRRWGDGLAYELDLSPPVATRVRAGRLLLIGRNGAMIERLDLSGLSTAAQRLDGCRG